MRTIVIAILFAATMLATGQNIEYPVMLYDTLPQPLDPYMGYSITLPNRGIAIPAYTETVVWKPPQEVMPVVYISYSPEDNGIGFRIDIDGGYMSMQYGNYRLPYGGYIKDHAKIAMGVVYKSYSLGLAYHRSGETKIPEGMSLTKSTLRPISIEAGVRVFVTDHFVSALRYDILRHEGTIEFGVRLYNAK